MIEYECKECGRVYEDPRQDTCCGEFLKSVDFYDSPVIWSRKMLEKIQGNQIQE